MAYRILSLDGGGTWALLQVMALQELYGHKGGADGATGYDVLSEFDLAVANSGGSIVLAGLMLNLPLREIRTLFEAEDKRRSIFKGTPLAFLQRAFPILPRYSTKAKRAGLSETMGPAADAPMAAMPDRPGWPAGPGRQDVKAVIVGFDYDQQRAQFFRTFRSGAGTEPSRVSLLDAVHASSNAPVIYFDQPTECDGRRYWDGAMGGYNNPVMAGVVEALSLSPRPAEVAVLSIGTGTVRHPGPEAEPRPPPTYALERTRPGPLNDVKKAATSINDDPPDAATYTAHIVLNGLPGSVGSVVRLNPVVQPILSGGAWTHPPGLSADRFKALAGLGMDAVREKDVDLIRELGQAWLAGAVPNQPIRFDSRTLRGELGDNDFPAARARWAAMT